MACPTAGRISYEQARTIGDIERDAKVGLSFQGKKGLPGKPPLFIPVEGHAKLVREKAAFEANLTKDLDDWFKDGIDTPGVVLIEVQAERIHYWDGQDKGDVPARWSGVACRGRKRKRPAEGGPAGRTVGLEVGRNPWPDPLQLLGGTVAAKA